MTHTDLRSASRQVLFQAPKGDFTILIDEREVKVLAVHDVSASGIRVQVESSLGLAARVRVRYREGPLDLLLNGITCWETAVLGAPQEQRIVGVDLMTPTLLYSILGGPA
jgi:hypothetical protein